MKISTKILNLFLSIPYWSTASLMTYFSAMGVSKSQVAGGIGWLCSSGQLRIVATLPYGHIFA